MPAPLTVRLAALLPVALLACACGSGGGTTTVTRTVTAPAAAPASPSAPASDPLSGAAPGTDSAPASGDGSSAPSAAALPDACSLLTVAQAGEVAGTPLMKGTGAGAKPGGGFVECQYLGLPNGPTAQLEVFVGDGAQQQLHIERDNLGHTFTSVPGVGDQCLQEDGYIFVHKDGIWVSINLVRLDDSALHVQPMRKGIAEIAAKL